MKKDQTGGRLIQSVDRALSILDLFNDQNEELTLSEISAAVQLNVSTTYGLVNTLHRRNYLGKNNLNGRYILGKAMLTPKLETRRKIEDIIIKEANWYMHQLCTSHAAAVMLFSYKNTILTNLKYLTPYPCEFHPIMDFHTSVSARMVMTQWTEKEIREYFAHKPMIRYTRHTVRDVDALLDIIKDAKEQGYSTEIDEIDPGWGAYAVPIYDPQGKIIATMSINCHTETLLNKKEEICGVMLNAAAEISQVVIAELDADKTAIDTDD